MSQSSPLITMLQRQPTTIRKTEKKEVRKTESWKFLIWVVPVGRVFANDPGDLSSIPGRVIPKALKMVLDTSLLNTQ